jgi:hypothetical protein
MKYYNYFNVKKVCRVWKMKKFLRQLRATEFLVQENIRQTRLCYLQNWDQFPDYSEFKMKGVVK